MDPRAAEYERRYPGTGVSEEQAIERIERVAKQELRRENRAARSFHSVPELPWLKKEQR